MDPNLYNNVIEQLEKLLQKRSEDVKLYNFNMIDSHKIGIVRDDTVLTIVNIIGFSIQELMNQGPNWVKYKTDALNFIIRRYGSTKTCDYEIGHKTKKTFVKSSSATLMSEHFSFDPTSEISPRDSNPNAPINKQNKACNMLADKQSTKKDTNEAHEQSIKKDTKKDADKSTKKAHEQSTKKDTKKAHEQSTKKDTKKAHEQSTKKDTKKTTNKHKHYNSDSDSSNHNSFHMSDILTEEDRYVPEIDSINSAYSSSDENENTETSTCNCSDCRNNKEDTTDSSSNQTSSCKCSDCLAPSDESANEPEHSSLPEEKDSNKSSSVCNCENDHDAANSNNGVIDEDSLSVAITSSRGASATSCTSTESNASAITNKQTTDNNDSDSVCNCDDDTGACPLTASLSTTNSSNSIRDSMTTSSSEEPV